MTGSKMNIEHIYNQSEEMQNDAIESFFFTLKIYMNVSEKD